MGASREAMPEHLRLLVEQTEAEQFADRARLAAHRSLTLSEAALEREFAAVTEQRARRKSGGAPVEAGTGVIESKTASTRVIGSKTHEHIEEQRHPGGLTQAMLARAAGKRKRIRAKSERMARTGDEADGTFTVTLPLPDRALSPNSRCHWRVKAKAVKAARLRAMLEAMKAMPAPYRWEAATIQFAFTLRDHRRHDGDNLEASMKAALDGLRDAGVIVDDSYGRLTRLPSAFAVDKMNAGVTVTMRKIGRAA